MTVPCGEDAGRLEVTATPEEIILAEDKSAVSAVSAPEAMTAEFALEAKVAVFAELAVVAASAKPAPIFLQVDPSQTFM